ncbi:hypothetical protein ACJMK2_021961 [Sinanodonta woodiana]|uniref:Uncharacterized protein n=1 Tax=Sinanodonta woodiana TaxID=1069815 RepID=A0ABD3THM6_SINWO
MLVISCNSSFEEAMSDVDCDHIEVLSSHIEDTEESFMNPVAQSIVHELEKLLQKEKERRRVARIVILVTGIMLVVSVVLIAVSLYMAKDIDELGKLFENIVPSIVTSHT